jgi:uncharacterized protein (DUF2141 family)
MNGARALYSTSSATTKALLLLTTAFAVARAQTGRITGTVADSAGGFPLSGVSITIVGSTAGGVSASEGRYVVTLQPGTYTVEARRLGYIAGRRAGVVVTAGQATTVDFKLQGRRSTSRKR